MAEVMTDFVLLEAAEDGEILEDITDDVTEGSNVEDIMFEVPLSDCTDSECCSRVCFFPPESDHHFQKIPYSHQNSREKGPRQILRQLVL